MEMKFSRSFSNSVVPAIIKELRTRLTGSGQGPHARHDAVADLKRTPSHHVALRAVAGTSMDDDDKGFLVELQKLAEQAQEPADA